MSSWPINPVDLSVLILIGLSCAIGFMRGLTRETLGLMGWLGAIIGTLYGFSTSQRFFGSYIQHPLLRDVVSGLVLFLIILITLTLIGNALSKMVKSSSLGGVDRSLGLLFGIVRGAVIVSLIYLGVLIYWHKKALPTSISSARAHGYLSSGARTLHQWLPHRFRPDVQFRVVPTNASNRAEIVRSLSTLKPASKASSSQGYNQSLESLLQKSQPKQT
ncbi:MAG: CvpA family protein [bacterium]|nr:CvpA family protein [bacterium]